MIRTLTDKSGKLLSEIQESKMRLLLIWTMINHRQNHSW